MKKLIRQYRRASLNDLCFATCSDDERSKAEWFLEIFNSCVNGLNVLETVLAENSIKSIDLEWEMEEVELGEDWEEYDDEPADKEGIE